jgi:hypothetical protein
MTARKIYVSDALPIASVQENQQIKTEFNDHDFNKQINH